MDPAGFPGGLVITERPPRDGSSRNAEILPGDWFKTYRCGAVDDTTAATGLPPVAKRLAGVSGGSALLTGGTTRSPLPVFTLSCVRFAPAKFVMYTKSPGG